MPIIRRRSRKLFYAGLAGAAAMGAVGAGILIYCLQDFREQQSYQRSRYEQRIAELEQSQLLQQNSMRTAWVPLRDIPPGHVIQANDLKEVRLPSEASPDNLASGKDEIAGKGTKIELLKGTPITSVMLFEEEPTPADLRHREMRAVFLPSNLRQGDVVDVRVQFPTGQDYIVLSKKKIDKLQGPAFWTTLSEQEILLLSSALVDAYMYQATIYALTYVEPELQDRAVPTYPPNAEVTKLIASDPNIVKKAERQLELAARKLLEGDLSRLGAGQQVYVSDMHGGLAHAGSGKGPDAWSAAYSGSSGGGTDREDLAGSGSFTEDERTREDREREAEQILSGYGTGSAPGEGTDGPDEQLIFSTP